MQLLDNETRSVLQVADYAERSGQPLDLEGFYALANQPKREVINRFTPEMFSTETPYAFLVRTKLISIEERSSVSLEPGRSF